MEMREFRGKRVDNGEWVYGYYFIAPITHETGECAHYLCADDSPGRDKLRYLISQEGVTFDVIPETVGQYIAKDKFDNKIYINSKVKIHDYSHINCDAQRGTLVYDEKEAMFRIEVGTEEYVPLIPREVEVIETPELLEQQ